MDVWLKWLISKSSVNKFIYFLGTIYMKIPFSIKSIPNFIVKGNLKSLKKRYKVYEKMNNILNDSVFLVLDLIEKVDFDYNDKDEVKEAFYESFLKLLYPNTSNLKDYTMEYWNMHTYSNKIINPEKISLLKDQNNYCANKILIKIIEKNKNYVKMNYKFLYEYYMVIKNR